MILLLGGTSETAPVATAILARGWRVLVSTATEAPLELPDGAERRCGRLDAEGLARLCRDRGIRILVDASHPFATALRAEARQAAERMDLPFLRFERPEGDRLEDALMAEDHGEAARRAFACGGPVVLTTGSRVLEPYVAESRRTGLPLLARVLDHPESLEACCRAGLKPAEWVTGRGPFTVEDTVRLLLHGRAAALVTKDSGEAGGVPLKAEAARQAGARLVVVRRPEERGHDLSALLEALETHRP